MNASTCSSFISEISSQLKDSFFTDSSFSLFFFTTIFSLSFLGAGSSFSGAGSLSGTGVGSGASAAAARSSCDGAFAAAGSTSFFSGFFFLSLAAFGSSTSVLSSSVSISTASLNLSQGVLRRDTEDLPFDLALSDARALRT